jgi:polygalacturonase
VASLLAAVILVPAAKSADPLLPSFGSSIFNVTQSYAYIANGATWSATNTTASNTTILQAFINYCSTNTAGGIGGTVEIPTGTFVANALTMKSNVDLQIDPGAILRNASPLSTFFTSSSSYTNYAISGGGTIDGAATTATSGNNLMNLYGSQFMVTNVTIQNSSHEHLVTKGNNITLANVTINDAGTLAANHGAYLANTDAIDYYGTNFLIKNCTISAGDDDICAKPASGGVANVVITNCSIGAGHGISFGGGTSKGVSNVVVAGCVFNGTDNGLRIKASDPSYPGMTTAADWGGGTNFPVTGIIFKDIRMTNVSKPLIIESFYNGKDNFPTNPTGTNYGLATGYTNHAISANTPIFQDISYQNIFITNSAYGGFIQGLNTDPNVNIQGLSFSNVTIYAATQLDMWYATNVTVDGLEVHISATNNPYINASPLPGVWTYGVGNLTIVPEPCTPMLFFVGLGLMILLPVLRRHR